MHIALPRTLLSCLCLLSIMSCGIVDPQEVDPLDLAGKAEMKIDTVAVMDIEQYLLESRGLVIEARLFDEVGQEEIFTEQYLDFLEKLMVLLDTLPEGKLYAPYTFRVQRNSFDWQYSTHVGTRALNVNARFPGNFYTYLMAHCPLVGSVEHQAAEQRYEKLKVVAFDLIRQIESPLFLKDTFGLRLMSVDNQLWDRAEELEQSTINYLTSEEFVLGLLKIKNSWSSWVRSEYVMAAPPSEGHTSFIALINDYHYPLDVPRAGTADHPFLIMTDAETVFSGFALERQLDGLVNGVVLE